MPKRILKLCFSSLIYCGDQLKVIYRQMIGLRIPPRYIVLYYHAISASQQERFAKQLDKILQLAKPFPLDMKNPDVDGRYYVALTFDDGYASFLQHALPELAKRNMPFTIFVPTGHIGKPPGWIPRGSQRFESERIMNEVELKQLNGFDIASIGSHCVTHRNLANMTEDEARNEILVSKEVLEKIIGEAVTTLSFPHGSFRYSHIRYAKDAGYERVCSIIPSPAFETEEEYVTGRINCDPDDWKMEFHLKCLGAYRWMRGTSHIKSRIKQIIQHTA